HVFVRLRTALPRRDDGEGEERAVEDAEHGVDGAGDLVVTLEEREADHTADDEHPADGGGDRQRHDDDRDPPRRHGSSPNPARTAGAAVPGPVSGTERSSVATGTHRARRPDSRTKRRRRPVGRTAAADPHPGPGGPMREMRAGELMTPNPITVNADASIQEVARAFRTHNIGFLPVVESEQDKTVL